MSQSDDSADDPQLKSLRAVWLSMPDEDPPSSGLDALMAAARAQAEVFATPPWWKRALHALARPPVLALATIMILIGGAVLISKRDDIKEGPSMGAPKPAVTPTVPVTPSETPPAPRVEPDKAVHEKLDVSPPPPPPPPPPALKPPPALELGRMDGSKPVAPAHKAPQTPRPRSSPSPVTTTTADTGKTSAAPGGAAFEAQEAPDKAKVEGGLMKTGEAPVDETRSGDAAPAQSRGPTPKQVMVDQLLVQCRSAATRGDCEEAKLLARRIAAQSTAYYKEHVANDTTIQKCITPAQAPNAVSQ